MGRPPNTAVDIFTRPSMTNESGCRLWLGALSSGYGQVRLDGRIQFVHRVAYELCFGPIPPGLHIDHLCRTRACFAPQHLEPVTPAENSRRAGDAHDRNTFCRHGHLRLGNTYPSNRRCKTCQREYERRLGRRAVGIELDERYCEIAARRLSQRVLFGEAS